MVHAAFVQSYAEVERRLKKGSRSRSAGRWPCHVSVRVAHSCPLLAAGLVATLQELPGYDVSLSDDMSASPSQPAGTVDILITDRRGDEAHVNPRWPGSRARLRASPRVVLLTADEPTIADRNLPCGRIDACLPIDCATDELLAAVCRLGRAALGPLTSAADEAFHPQPVQRGLAPGVLRRVRGYIEQHLVSGADLDSLAQIAGMSSCHFSRAFKQSTGMPPHRYLITRRISAAIALIRDTDLPLSDISLEAGFADQSHFTRTFVQLTGETPGEFRHRIH